MAEIVEMEKPKPQLLLPFAEKEWVSIDRAAGILGVKWPTVRRMAESAFIHMIQVREHGPMKVRYQSIVDYCDQLRDRYAIPDRRPKLSSAMFRHKDRDILPFPIEETMTVPDAMPILGYRGNDAVIRLCEEGAFESYRLTPRFAWRIYRPSFEIYVNRVMGGIPRGPRAYKPVVEL